MVVGVMRRRMDRCIMVVVEKNLMLEMGVGGFVGLSVQCIEAMQKGDKVEDARLWFYLALLL